MSGIGLIISFIIAIIVMIVAISKFKVHPFIALMGISLILAIVVGIPLANIPNMIGAGFSGTFSSIGIVIILGALIGTILEKTGGALKLAEMVVRLVGKKHPDLAVELMGWVVSIPVFCDSGFVILDPIRGALQKRTGYSSVALTVALSAGLYTSHVFIPPTPGPIAAASSLGVGDHLLMVMGIGALVSIPCLIAAYFYANYIGKRVKTVEDKNDVSAEEYEKLLNFLMINPLGKNAGIMIAQMCGLRIGEVCGLKWEDVDLNERVIHVRRTISRLYISSLDSDAGSSVINSGQPKTRRSQRKVPIPKRLCYYLEQVKLKDSPDEKSFITTGKDKSHEPRTFNSYYCNVLKRSEIEHHTFHSLRHTFATRAVRMGMDAETLSRILGHASVTITLSRYYHPTTKDLVNAIDKIYS